VSPSPPAVGPQGAARARDLPHIVIVSGDGIDASHTSLYGHERRTTPFLLRLAQSALVFDNAFPNVNSSAGSVASLATGKPPLRTNLLLHPDILTGVDAYQHLPGVLRGLGYRTIHVSTRLYTDPFEQNMQHAFDVANFRERRGLLALPALPGRLALAYMPALYFLGETGERLSERVLHVAGVRVMTNALTELQRASWVSDDARIQAVLDFLDRADGPVFAHVHLMGTHIPLVPRRPVFSAAGPCPPTEWALTMNTYDDAIADFDRDVERIVGHLTRSGQFERTILVVTSDHGWLWSYVRLPLMLRFPGGVPSGRKTENTQLIDVPPTLLDYLGVPIPEWMGGASLLRPIDPLRPIFTVRIRKVLDGPFRRVRTLGLTVCERVFWLNPHVGGFFDDEVQGYVGPCGAGVPTRETAWTRLVDELRMNGYDVSSLSDRPPPASDLPKRTATPAAGGGR
jgi:arylsulfatase A-like enzyme